MQFLRTSAFAACLAFVVAAQAEYIQPCKPYSPDATHFNQIGDITPVKSKRIHYQQYSVDRPVMGEMIRFTADIKKDGYPNDMLLHNQLAHQGATTQKKATYLYTWNLSDGQKKSFWLGSSEKCELTGIKVDFQTAKVNSISISIKA